MLNRIKREFSSRIPLKFMQKVEDPVTRYYHKLTYGYPFKSMTPVTKAIVNSSLVVFLAWQFMPYKYMFRHFQVSEYTIQRGYLHTVFTGSISHRDFGHLVPNVGVYLLFGKLIEGKCGSRHMFYLSLFGSLAGIAAVVLKEKVLVSDEDIGKIVPKCNGSVVAGALAGAVLAKYPLTSFNPLRLKHSIANELFMFPMFIPVVFWLMLEYYMWSQGYVEHIAPEAHFAGFLSGALYALRYLR